MKLKQKSIAILTGALCLVIAVDLVLVCRNARASRLLSNCLPASEKAQLRNAVASLQGQLNGLLVAQENLTKETRKFNGAVAATRVMEKSLRNAVARLAEEVDGLEKFEGVYRKATCNGKYYDLEKVELRHSGAAEYGDFRDIGEEGWFKIRYWVYAYPYFFVWKASRVVDARHARKTAEREAEQARSEAERAAQKKLEERFGSELDAMLIAQKFVKNHLLHPSTARFPFSWLGATFFNKSTKQWHVTGTVKAKTAFGVELKYRWKVICRKVRGDVWEEIETSIWEEGS